MVSLSLEHRLGQFLFIGIPGPTLDEETRKLLQTVQPGGVILFARNIEQPEQVAELNAEIRRLLKVPPLISVDQEGGRVDRLKKICPPMASPHLIRASDDARLAHDHGSITAELLRLLGFNMNFAPVLDIAVHEEADNALQERFFGSRLSKIIRLASAYLEGLQNNNVLGCGKHFPGLGDSVVDSHKELPIVERNEQKLMSEDIQIYTDLSAKLNSQLQAIMVAHAFYPAFEGGSVKTRVPASLSPRIVTDLLRTKLEFQGMAISDDLEMGAITESMGFSEAVVSAIAAGEDMLLICQSPARVAEASEALVKSVRDGQITGRRIETSINRIARIKSMASSPLYFNHDEFRRICDKITEFNYRLELHLKR
ncbi:MAG: beta-N-acetylhexosaminidase [Blastocatellia bacterium]|nr:beta-N-acetylhexosaminidase [Blastocatellia bacterium]